MTVEVGGRRVLESLSLQIDSGESHVLFGPNGSGKTSLVMSILGFPNQHVTSGRILLKGVDITAMPSSERVRLGVGVAFQNPPTIRGVKLDDILRRLAKPGTTTTALARMVNFPHEFLSRDLNLGFSGGEVKRSEVLQVLAQQPDLAIFDEPDSGVDVENLEVIGRAVNTFLQGRAGLLITHLGHILRYVQTNRAHVLINGSIRCSGKPTKILSQIMREGYKWCERCPETRKC